MDVEQMRTRYIPSSREPLGVVGCGTYMAFDRAPGSPGFAQLTPVLKALFDAGGSVVDSSPMYVGSSRVDLQACKLEYSIVSPK